MTPDEAHALLKLNNLIPESHDGRDWAAHFLRIVTEAVDRKEFGTGGCSCHGCQSYALLMSVLKEAE